MGAGVAGLQAIATAKRMGAIVFATDVRSQRASGEFGWKILTVEGSENLETEEDMQKRHLKNLKKTGELIAETLKK